MNTDITFQGGGRFQLFAVTYDEDGSTRDVEIFFKGAPTGVFLQSAGSWTDFEFWSLQARVGPGTPPTQYLIELVARDNRLNNSLLYPYLHITTLGTRSYETEEFAPMFDWERLYSLALETTSKQSSPFILLAGYWLTELSEENGGMFIMLAAVNDADGYSDIEKVEVYFNGKPTGLKLRDDGRNDDFGAGEGIFGFKAPLLPEDMEGTAGRYLLELKAFDKSGNSSHLWPYLVIE